MRMIMHPAGAEIVYVGGNNKDHSGDQQPELVLVKDLFEYKETEPGQEDQERKGAVVVFFEAMVKGPGPDQKGQYDHPHLKSQVIDDIDTEEGQAAHEQGQEGTMNGTGQ